MAYNLLASVVPADVKPNQPIWLNNRDYTMGFLRSETTAKHKVVIVSKAAVHDDVIKWKHFPRYWPFMRGTAEFPTQRPVTRSFDEFFFICAWIKDWVNNHEAGDLRRHCAHYDVIVMASCCVIYFLTRYTFYFQTLYTRYTYHIDGLAQNCNNSRAPIQYKDVVLPV